MKSKYFLSTTILLLFTINNCNTTDSPIDDDNLQPGRRDYIWTADTLDTQNNRIQCIWGSSPTDVWAGGAGGITPYDRLWHFDGNDWKPYSQYIPVFPTCLFGFAQNDVWLGGNDGKIFHFNGAAWIQYYMFWSDTLHSTEVRSLCGITPDNIYAVGLIYYNINEQPHSFVLHYDGKNWDRIYVTSEYVQFLELDIDGKDVYIYGFMNPTDSTSATVSFYKMENNQPHKIFQKATNEITWASPCNIGEHTYFLINKNLTTYNYGEFKNLITFNSNNFNYYVSGRSLKDIFLHNRDGLAHYNGEDIVYLYQFDDSFISIYHKPLILENEVFFTVKDNLTDANIILMGKLN